MNLKQIIEHRPVLLSLGINFILFSITLILFTPHFDTNDDVGMMLWASGTTAVSSPQSHLIFTHFLVGRVLVFFYNLVGSFPWYGCYLIGTVFISHFFMLAVWLKKCPREKTLWLYLVYYLLMGNNMVLQLQFSISASLLILSGFTPFLSTTLPNWSPRVNAASILMILLGSMIRWDILLMATALFAPLALFQLKENFARTLKFYFLFLGLTFLVAGGFRYWDQSTYTVDPSWQDHLSVHPYITRLIDFGGLENLPPQDMQNILTDFSWSENDYRMANRWFYLDTTIYNQKNLSGLLSAASGSKQRPDLLLGPYAAVRILVSPVGMGLLVFAMLILFFGGFNFRSLLHPNFLALVASVITVTLLIFYLCYFKKPPPARIYLGMLFYLALVLFGTYGVNTSARPVSFNSRNISLMILAVLLLTQTVFSVSRYIAISNNTRSSSTTFHRTLKQINPNPGNLYVNWGDSFPWESVMPLEDISYLQNFRTFDLGGSERTPFAREVLQEYRIDNLYKALTENKYLYLIISDTRKEYMGLYLEFMHEHYGYSLSPEVQGRYGSFSLFQFSHEIN